MKIRICLIALLVASVFQLQAQSVSLHGKITDINGKPIEFASISSQGKITFSSLKGEFSMTLQSADSVVVKFSMIGYKTKTRILRRPKGTQRLMVTLLEEENTLETVDVKGQRIQTGDRKSVV